MFNLADVSRSTQQAICMFVSVLIVAAALSIGAYEAQAASQVGYSITITQLQ